jgi:hypothetical protein
MLELLIRTETLFFYLEPLWLLGIGVPALIVGLVFWLGGVRYSTPITGLLGALVGAVAGLLVSQWLKLHLVLSTVVGAAVVATVSVLLRNPLILVLAVLVVATAAGGGYLAVILEKVTPPEPAQQTDADAAGSVSYQSFRGMSLPARLDYVDRLARQEEDFSERVRAIGNDTYQAAQPYLWKLILAVLAGAVVSIFLLWFVRKALIALAYSVVGTAVLVVGAQTALLAANFKAASALPPNPWLLPGTCGGMVAFGWLVQLVTTRKPKEQAKASHKDAEEA